MKPRKKILATAIVGERGGEPPYEDCGFRYYLRQYGDLLIWFDEGRDMVGCPPVRIKEQDGAPDTMDRLRAIASGSPESGEYDPVARAIELLQLFNHHRPTKGHYVEIEFVAPKTVAVENG